MKSVIITEDEFLIGKEVHQVPIRSFFYSHMSIDYILMAYRPKNREGKDGWRVALKRVEVLSKLPKSGISESLQVKLSTSIDFNEGLYWSVGLIVGLTEVETTTLEDAIIDGLEVCLEHIKSVDNTKPLLNFEDFKTVSEILRVATVQQTENFISNAEKSKKKNEQK